MNKKDILDSKPKFGFMSSVYPQATLPELIKIAKKYNYEHIELRVEWGHKHNIGLASTTKELKEAKSICENEGIPISCLSTSIRFSDTYNINNRVDMLNQYIIQANAIGAKNVRIFGDPIPKADPKTIISCFDRIAAGIQVCDETAGKYGITICLETHRNFLASFAIDVLYRSEAKNAMVNWHAMHHVRYGQSIQTAFIHLYKKIGHVHISFGEENKIPEQELQVLNLLFKNKYDSFISIEMINPKKPEQILKQHADLYNKYLNKE